MQNDFIEIFEKINSTYKIKHLPKLRTLFKGASTNLLNLINLLVRKSLLKENLYNYDEEKNEFSLPEEKPFLEGEKSRVLYDRLKATLHAFDYLANNIPSDIYSLSLTFLDNIRKLLNYFSFHYFISSSNINTKALKEMCDRLLASNDKIINKILEDNIKLLSDNYKKILSLTDELLKIKKEEYKYNIRFKVFPFLHDSLDYNLLKENPALFLKNVSEYMKTQTPDIPIYKNWLIEALTSCFTKTENEELEALKKNFLFAEKNIQQPQVLSSREKLIKIIKTISQTHIILEKLYLILENNLKIIKEQKKGFFENFLSSIKKAFRTKDEEYIFVLEYINPKTKNIEKEEINFFNFIESLKKKIVLYKAIQKSDSQINEKINRGTEDSLYKFIEDNYFDLLLLKERIIGLEGEIRLKVNKRFKYKLKDIAEDIEKLDEILKTIAEERKKYVLEEEKKISGNQKK